MVGTAEVPGTREGPLCWGQHWSWLLDAAPSKRQSPAAAVGLVTRLPAGATMDSVRCAVDAVVERHESLRSFFVVGRDGSPTQRVLSTCTPAVKVVDLSSRDGSETVADLTSTLDAVLDKVWDVATEVPVRVVIGTVRGVPELALLSVHIVAVDGVSMSIVLDELLRAIASRGAGRDPTLSPVQWQPLDQARFEASPRMRERNRRNLDRWKEFFDSSPPTALPFYWENILGYGKGTRALLASRALGPACTTVARRCSASESAVLLAAVGAMLAAWSGHARTIIGETVACRYTPAMQSSVGRYKAVTRLLVDVSEDLAFDDLVQQVRIASARAHVESVCEEGELAMSMSRASVRHGSRLEYPPQFNYHHYSLPDRVDIRGGDPVIARRLPGSAWFATSPEPGAATGSESRGGAPPIVTSDDDIPLPLPLFDVWPSGDGGLQILLRCSTQLLPDGGFGFLEQLDRLVRTVADRPRMLVSEALAMLHLPRFWGGPRWIAFRGSWFSLDDVCRLLRRHPSVAAAQVFHDGAGRLSAYVSASDDRLTAEHLHEHMRDQASTWPTVILPYRYTVCRGVPRDEVDRDQWRAHDVLDAGAGRAASRTTPDCRNERVLLRSLAAVVPQLEPDLAASYAELHGDFLRIPAIIGELAKAGYHGLTHQDLLGMATLARLAGKLKADVEDARR